MTMLTMGKVAAFMIAALAIAMLALNLNLRKVMHFVPAISLVVDLNYITVLLATTQAQLRHLLMERLGMEEAQ